MAAILTAGRCATSSFQFFSEGSATGARDDAEVLRALLVRM
jgi:hypothetical protein